MCDLARFVCRVTLNSVANSIRITENGVTNKMGEQIMKKWLAMGLLMISCVVNAQDIGFSGPMTQDEFRAFAKEMGTALWFSPGSPAESLGVTGFDVSADLILTDVNQGEGYWQHMTLGDTESMMTATRVHAQKGLPFGLDVGVMVLDYRDSNASAWGLEFRYALLDGSTIMPAVSARLSYAKLNGVDDLSMSTTSLDLMISKGFLMVTPYGGISLARVDATPNMEGIGLHGINENITQVFAGVQISPLPFLVINGEVVSGEVKSYSLKAGIRF